MVDEVRRRTTQAHRLRRGRKTDPEWINRRRLLRARRTTHRRPTHPAVRAADLRRPQRRHRRRLDRQGTPAGRVGVHRSWRPALRNHRRTVRFYTFCAACSVPEIHQARRNNRNLAGANDSRDPDRTVQRPQRRLQPDRQTRRSYRLRVQNTRKPTPPSTVGLHPPITASAIQHQTAAPLLTRKSRRSGPEPPERRDQGPKLGRDCLTAISTMRNHSGRQSSSIGGRRSATCEPTNAKNSVL